MDFITNTKKEAVEIACQNLIRNMIVSNNLNITYIMDNAKFTKNLIFDKIIINTFRRCIDAIDYQKANQILTVNLVTYYNSTDAYACPVYPEEYNFNSAPIFDNSEKQILEKFYGVKSFFLTSLIIINIFLCINPSLHFTSVVILHDYGNII